jgi:IS1 family transposase
MLQPQARAVAAWRSACPRQGRSATQAQRREITGNPDKKHISTSYVELKNLTMRMHMKRYARLSNGFSKRLENHMAALALHFMFYNFV